MTTDLLRRAREHEKAHLAAVSPAALPHWHVTGGVGWINDPNGFSLYKGEYHLFFQYNPYDTVWDTMHWGHIKSRDFIRWERLPAALAPDAAYDESGCFSGSGIELDDGRHLLVYTGVHKEQAPDGTEKEFQTQCVAIGDGVDYEKYAGNPVITGADLPEGGSARDFRDPKIWREDGKFYLVAGDRCPDGSGAILLYESEDALHWHYAGTLAESSNRYGRMWECPDFFELDGTHVLLTSPQEMRSEGLEFIDGNTTLCLIGQYDKARRRLLRQHEQTIDYGLDFYAPQTTLTADGRRVMIAWMQYWNSVDYRPPEKLPFFGQMTTPRELHFRDGRLIQNPVRELEAYRGKAVRYADFALDGEAVLDGVSGRCLDLTVTIRPDAERGLCRDFTISLAKGGGYETTIRYTPGAHTICVDRSRSGLAEQILNRREFAVRDRGGVLKLRILLDRYSLEIFVNDGEEAATFVLYAPQDADGISFASDGALRLDLEQYTLEFDDHGNAI